MSSLKQHFATAIRRMLRPVVRQLIAHGISYPAFSEIVKQLYVDVAEQDFALRFKRQTDSRLALVTGLNRKEVAQLRKQSDRDETQVEVEDTPITHVIGRWMAEPPYAIDGKPQAIPYEAVDPKGPSFTQLVRDLHVDIPVRSVLDELIRIGTVELRADGMVVLEREVHIPPGGAEGKMTLLGTDPAELFTTIVHNIEHPENPRLQRKVVYDNVGTEALKELREASRTLGEDVVRRANTLLGSYDRDHNPGAPGGERARVSFGVYYFEETGAESEEPAAGKKPSPPGRITRGK